MLENKGRSYRSLVCDSKGLPRRDLACLECKQQFIIAKLSIKLLRKAAICATTIAELH